MDLTDIGVKKGRLVKRFLQKIQARDGGYWNTVVVEKVVSV